MENYEHYITRNIKSYYKKKLVSPILYLILLVILWCHFSLTDILNPITLNGTDDLAVFYETHSEYVSVTLTGLHFTGYTENSFGQIRGYYYYAMRGDDCVLILLSPDTCEQGLPLIEELTFFSRIEHRSALQSALLSSLADDLGWTESGISQSVSPYFFNEPSYHYGTSVLLVALFLISGLYALLSLICSILYILFPVLCPNIRCLSAFGKPSALLAEAEEELATLPQLATEDMFITEHYFIEVTAHGIAVVPISEIIWIYKHSTLHKFLWYHFSISYTLSITANKHVYIQCPKNMKSDIDGIIDYLSEANHNILVGFSEENRLKVQKIQGTPLQLDKLIALLKRRI